MEVDWTENEFHKACIQYWVCHTDPKYRGMEGPSARALEQYFNAMAQKHSFPVTLFKTLRVGYKLLVDKMPE